MARIRHRAESVERVASAAPTVVFAFCSWASIAGADPIRVTSGFVEAEGFEDQRTLTGQALQLFGAGFRIESSLEEDMADHLLTVPAEQLPAIRADLAVIGGRVVFQRK